MGKKLSFTNIIESDVVSRNESTGNISSLKKVMTNEGCRVFFSDKTSKRAVWDTALSNSSQGEWKNSECSDIGGVVQRTSTIVDSEELDFAGTMVAKPVNYSRDSVFVCTYGKSLNEYVHCLEFNTNMGLAKALGMGKNSIYNREFFSGVYKMSGLVDLDRVGVQDIAIPKKISVSALELEEGMRGADVFKAIHKAMRSMSPSISITEEEFADTLTGLFNLEVIRTSDKTFIMSLNVEDNGVRNGDNGDNVNDEDEDEDEDVKEARKVSELMKGIISGKNIKENLIDIFKHYLTKGIEDENEVEKITDPGKKGYVKKLGIVVKKIKDSEDIEVTMNKAVGKKPVIIDGCESSDIAGKLRWICNTFNKIFDFPMDPDDYARNYSGRFDDGGYIKIEYDKSKSQYNVRIVLSPGERIRRVMVLARTLCGLMRTMEGRFVNLAPSFSVWSTELPLPAFHNIIKDPGIVNGSAYAQMPRNRMTEEKEIGPQGGGSYEALYKGKKIYYGKDPDDFLDELEKEISGYYSANREKY